MSNSDRDTSARDLQRALAPLRQQIQHMPLSEDVRGLVEELRRALRGRSRD